MRIATLLVSVPVALATGCTLDVNSALDALSQIEEALTSEVDSIQLEDPRDANLPVGLVEQGDTIIIDNSVTVVNNVSEDLVIEELPDITLLGFENITGADIYLQYLVDGELQGVLVFDGETLLLEYPCLDEVEILSEQDFDPETGVLIVEFDLSGSIFLNGFDFYCGEALIITIDPFSLTASAEAIDLVE